MRPQKFSSNVCNGWRLSGDLPMRPWETLSLTVTLPDEQRIEVPAAVVVVWAGRRHDGLSPGRISVALGVHRTPMWRCIDHPWDFLYQERRC